MSRTKGIIKEPYKQFMFHFQDRDSINANNMNKEEWTYIMWEIGVGERTAKNSTRFNYKVALKLLQIWYPERLI